MTMSPRPPGLHRLLVALWVCCLFAPGAGAATTAMGLAVIAAQGGHGPITVFYPTGSPSRAVVRGPFTFDAVPQGAVQPGNRRLVVFSHGSGGSPWPMADLARALVTAGFVVAIPEHDGDNYRDQRWVGPESWKRRPAEVAAAIDALQADPRFGPVLDVDRGVGVYGTSAGGLTALTLAGARWSPAMLMQHCLAHMEDDFPACVGLAASLHGDWRGPATLSAARWVHRMRFDDPRWQRFTDSRIRAVVASVPMAAPIDPASIARPLIAVGLMRAARDRWLAPRFHVDAVRAACASCELLADLAGAGHGSYFSPWPAALAAGLTPLLIDPPGFARGELPAVYERVAMFFSRHLVAGR